MTPSLTSNSGSAEPALFGPPGDAHHQYFRHVDGLRALAIIPVVLFHLVPGWCPGGFAGVDVFFVISGFLITRGIVSDLRRGTFSFRMFYVRRIKRILPAYLGVIAFILLALPFLYSFYRYRSVCLSAVYSAFYAANIYFNSVISYFDVDAKENPLLHLWSLAVEEQFYLFAPAVIWLLWTIRKKWLVYELAALLAASLFFSWLCIHDGRGSFAFYMLPSRAWELLTGSLVSLVPQRKAGGRPLSSPIAWLGLGLVAVPYFVYSERVPFPGLAAIPPVLGAALLILHGGEGRVGHMLSWRPVVGIGKGSYSLYLWHWPLFVIFGSVWSVRRGVAGLVCAVIATFISYRWIETPIRKSSRIGTRGAFALAAIGTLSIAIPCWLIISGDSRNGDIPQTWRGVPTWEAAEKAREPIRSSCTLADLSAPGSKLLIKIGAQQAPPTFALWGDSFALALLPGVDSEASEYGKAGYFVNLKHSLTMDADIGAYPFDPARDREPVLLWLESRRDIADVLLVNNWYNHLRNQADVDAAVAICARLAGAGKRVFLFNDPPIGNEEALRKLSWGMRIDPSSSTMDRGSYDARSYWQTKLAAIVTNRNLAKIIPMNEAFLQGDHYYTTTDSRSYFLNFDHVNQDGAIKAMKFAGPLIWDQPGPAPGHP
jgi:peptidoglycan/LPS O-acetylase OafA/YrhL